MFYLCALWSFRLCVHHHRYWLWYTTQRFVCGGVRKVYQKLKQFKVQFFVLQRKTDPSQVMLQCLPSNKVCTSPSLCAVIVYFNRTACDIDQCLYSSPLLSASVWCLSLIIMFEYYLNITAEMLNADASCPGGQQGAVFVSAI